MMGLDARTFFSTWVSFCEPPTIAKYLMAYLADTVLPAPDSPLTMIDWFCSNLHRKKHGEWKNGNQSIECSNPSRTIKVFILWDRAFIDCNRYTPYHCYVKGNQANHNKSFRWIENSGGNLKHKLFSIWIYKHFEKGA